MEELIVRKAEKSDIDSIEALEQKCFTVPWSRDSLEYDMLKNDLSTYVVAEVNGEVVGYVGFWLIVGEAHINNVAVSPDYRKRHIGSALIHSIISWLEELEIYSQTLEVRVSNEAAIGLYKKYGFTEAGIRPGYYEDNGEDAMIMWRNSKE